jgi:hypothetical protein
LAKTQVVVRFFDISGYKATANRGGNKLGVPRGWNK